MSAAPQPGIGILVWDSEIAALVTVREIRGPLFNTPNNRPDGATKYPAWITLMDIDRLYFSTATLSQTAGLVDAEQIGFSYTEFNPPKFAPQGGKGVVFAMKEPDKYANEEWLSHATFQESLTQSQTGSPFVPVYVKYWTPIVDGMVCRPPDQEPITLSELEAEISATIRRLAPTPRSLRRVTPEP